MKRFSILSLLLMFVFQVVPAFAGGDDEEPPNNDAYVFNDCIGVQLMASQNPTNQLPLANSDYIPASTCGSHSGSLQASNTVRDNVLTNRIRTVATAQLIGQSTVNVDIAHEGHGGSDNVTFSCGYIYSSSWYEVEMEEPLFGDLTTTGGWSYATINILSPLP